VTDTPTAQRVALYLLASFVVIWLMREARTVVVPVAFALFLAMLGSPAMRWLRHRKVPSGIAATLVVLAMMGVLVVTIGIITTSLQQLSTRVPVYQVEFDARVNEMLASTDDEVWSVRDVLDTIDPSAGMGFLVGVLTDVLGVLGNMFLILVIAAFMLIEGDVFPAKLAAAFGGSPRREASIHRFTISVTRYAALKTVVCLATGLAAGLFCWAVGVDLPLLMGFLAFVLNYIPNIGSWIAGIPAVLLAFVMFGPDWALFVALGYMLINLVISNVIEPRIMGHGLDLSPLVVFLSVMFSGWMLGPVGVILSIPIVMSVRFALEAVPSTRHLAVLFASGLPRESSEGS
jgi:AI-2 transport protein TqsA